MVLRRSLLLLVVVPSALAACSASAERPVDDGEAHLVELPRTWDRVVTRPGDDTVAARSRAACTFKKGALPAETLGADVPVDVDIPIKNVVVLMQENRSFDSYFGHLNSYAKRTDIESAPEDTSNPERVDDPTSARHPWTHGARLCISDTNHEWSGSHVEVNGGKMNGFFQANQGFVESGEPDVDPEMLSGERALWWYDERDIPFYYDLASTFAIGDHYHASLLGPTWPNRDFLYAATSRGVATNVKPDLTELGFPAHDALIFDELERRKVPWIIFVDAFPHVPRVGSFLGASYLTRWSGPHIEPLFRFYQRAAEGTLPEVAFVDGAITEDVRGTDEHPPADIQIGQKFVSQVTHALFKSPQWSSLALFIAYDENGGIYDHVVPPAACPPDELEPNLTDADDRAYPGGFDQMGMRVPVMVVSPFTKRGYVSHRTYDHTSITRFIETKFKLPALTSRDANADPMLDFFDFANPPFLVPPSIVEAQIDGDRLKECVAIFAPPPPDNR